MDWVYTSTEIGGILIEEPMTSLTDFITGVVGVLAFFRLQQLGIRDRAHRWFKYYFLYIGIATICAAILGHALQYIVGFNAKAIGWTFSTLALFCLENAALSYYQKKYGNRALAWLRLVFILQLLAFIGLVLYPPTRVFLLVKINSFIGMVLFSLPLFYFFHKKHQHRGSKIVVAALLFSFIPGIIYNTQYSLHTYMNYHDISHLLMALYVYVLYQGCKLLGLEANFG